MHSSNRVFSEEKIQNSAGITSLITRLNEEIHYAHKLASVIIELQIKHLFAFLKTILSLESRVTSVGALRIASTIRCLFSLPIAIVPTVVASGSPDSPESRSNCSVYT